MPKRFQMAEAIHGRFFLLNVVTDFYNLYLAYRRTLLGKGYKSPALRYSGDAVNHLFSLQERLENRTYKLAPYHSFKVHEPKERDVLAIDFEGKILQHSLCENVLYPVLTRSFILDNYASQNRKGVHYGLDRLTRNLRHYFFMRKTADEMKRRAAGIPLLEKKDWYYSDGWVLKGDFKKYFYSLDHDILFKKVMDKIQKIDDQKLIDFCGWIIKMIIDSTPNPGIPIGNQSSQLFALLFLDTFDHTIKDEWGIKYYGRYMDDFYIIHESKEELIKTLKRIEKITAGMKLSLNKRTQIFPLRHGLDFLGFRTLLTPAGKVVRKLRNNSKNKMRRKIKKFRELVDTGRMDTQAVIQSYTSWRGHASHGNTYKLKSKFDTYFYKTFPELRGKIKGAKVCLNN
jgi:hypothetical protein